MMVSSSLTEAPVLVTTHQNADFDSLAATVGALRLYPDAVIVFSGSLNPNVREFVALHGDTLPIASLRSVDLETVRQLVVVDTADCERLGELTALCGRPGVEVIVFDHHQSENPVRPTFVKGENWVVSADGSQAASMLYILMERGLEVSRLDATIFALGIHEDTGSLTYPRTTIRDAEMLAASMRRGASQGLIERYLHSALTREQRKVLMRMVDAVRVERVRGLDVHVVALDVPGYVDGLSVIAHKLLELLNCEILLQAVGMEGRVFVTARSRAGSVDVGALLHTISGGGHAQAASAVIKTGTPEEVLRRLLDTLAGGSWGAPSAREIMSRPVRFIDASTPVTEALVAAQRYGHSGICVKEGGRVVGIVARRDLDKAVRHGLGHAPVKGVMTRNIAFAPESATVDELRRLLVEGNLGRVPVVKEAAVDAARKEGSARVEDVIGIATRTDVLGAFQGRWEEEQARLARPHVYKIRTLAAHHLFGRLFQSCSALSEEFAGVYLVGGFVRDLLLNQPNTDVDIAVEGDGPKFARRLAAQLGGRVRTHPKFQTAVVVLPPEVLGEEAAGLRPAAEPFHVDVATTRTEFYDYPAALPRVEHASIRQDLFRRDFTVNAMAVSLRGKDFGAVFDFFGGLRDLRQGVIRVLHNLSFIEDPTRIFRAVRYENRYGFRMDEQTRAFAKACVDMHLVGDLSSVRLRDELIALLSEDDIEWTLRRLYELGVAREVHPKLATGERTVALVRRLRELTTQLQLHSEIVNWRLRLAALTRNMTHDELYLWLDRLKLRRADSSVIRAGVVVGPHLEKQLSKSEMGEWHTYHMLERLPVEAVLFAVARFEDELAVERAVDYLRDLRHRTLEISGDDLLALGVPKGPRVGQLLDRVRRLRVENRVCGRETELAAARALLKERQ